MKALLMHQDRDFDLADELPWNAPFLEKDLELGKLLDVMSGDDEFLRDIARRALFAGLKNDIPTILYRQAILGDCLRNPAVVRNLYDCVVATIHEEKKHWWFGMGRYPSAILNTSISLLQMFTRALKELRAIADENTDRFESQGVSVFFTMLQEELSDEYIASVESHLVELQFNQGVLLSAELGSDAEGTNYVLRKSSDRRLSWLERFLGKGPKEYTFSLAPRDEAGARFLSELQDRGINQVANALAQSSDHILSFFHALRTELAFYVGCLNLHERLTSKGLAVTFPKLEPSGVRSHASNGLYDVSLALSMDREITSNSVNADGKSLVIITGPNQGGKSSFLRAVGLAQLMMQCGLFVGADGFQAELCPALFTHYKREEDATMVRGKFDEELARMSKIVEHLVPGSIILLNESFAATNEREGSEIARQIVSAFLEKGMRVFFVTHFYEFAHGFSERRAKADLFLRAERKADGTRTFKIIEGEPLETSFGQDLYMDIFRQ